MSSYKLERRVYETDCTADPDCGRRPTETSSRPFGTGARCDDWYCEHMSLIRSVINEWVPA